MSPDPDRYVWTRWTLNGRLYCAQIDGAGPGWIAWCHQLIPRRQSKMGTRGRLQRWGRFLLLGHFDSKEEAAGACNAHIAEGALL